jgi:hypothetical protein
MDSFVKQKLADMMSRGLKISGLQARERQFKADLEKSQMLLDESKKAENEYLDRIAQMGLLIHKYEK